MFARFSREARNSEKWCNLFLSRYLPPQYGFTCGPSILLRPRNFIFMRWKLATMIWNFIFMRWKSAYVLRNFISMRWKSAYVLRNFISMRWKSAYVRHKQNTEGVLCMTKHPLSILIKN